MIRELKRHGAKVCGFPDPQNALSEIKIQKPELIILDIMMPQMTGFEVIKLIKSDNETKNIKIIIVSGRQFIKDRQRSIELGADDYIDKPYQTTELVHKIKELCNKN